MRRPRGEREEASGAGARRVERVRRDGRGQVLLGLLLLLRVRGRRRRGGGRGDGGGVGAQDGELAREAVHLFVSSLGSLFRMQMTLEMGTRTIASCSFSSSVCSSAAVRGRGCRTGKCGVWSEDDVGLSGGKGWYELRREPGEAPLPGARHMADQDLMASVSWKGMLRWKEC